MIGTRLFPSSYATAEYVCGNDDCTGTTTYNGFIKNVRVMPCKQGTGLGRELVAELIVKAQEFGGWPWLYCRADVVGFWQKCGFVVVAPIFHGDHFKMLYLPKDSDRVTV